jgi:hypothetical protein
MNTNKINFGEKQNKTKVDEVILPKWAKTP